MPACSLTIASGTYLEGVTALAVRDPTSPVATEVVAIALSTTRGRAARRSMTPRSAGGWSTRACRKRTAPTRCRRPQRSSPGGTVTAGNSSGINDGAAALLVASELAVQRYGLAPLARVTAGAAVDVRAAGHGHRPGTGNRQAARPDRAGRRRPRLDRAERKRSPRSRWPCCVASACLPAPSTSTRTAGRSRSATRWAPAAPARADRRARTAGPRRPAGLDRHVHRRRAGHRRDARSRVGRPP